MRFLNMFITFLILPIFMVRAWYLKRVNDPNRRHKELKRYPYYFLGLRRRKVIVHNAPSSHEAAIYISNHQSHNDIFVLLDAIAEPFRFIAKKELFTNPFLVCF